MNLINAIPKNQASKQATILKTKLRPQFMKNLLYYQLFLLFYSIEYVVEICKGNRIKSK